MVLQQEIRLRIQDFFFTTADLATQPLHIRRVILAMCKNAFRFGTAGFIIVRYARLVCVCRNG